MKKWLIIIGIAMCSGCSTIKIPVDKSTVFVKSSIPEKHRLVKDRFVQKPFPDVTTLSISFKDETLKNGFITINFSEKDYDKDNGPRVASLDYKLLDSIKVGDYTAKVWSASSQHPYYNSFDEEFKVICVWSAKQGVYMLATSTSNFKDNITPQFVIQKLSELEFTVKPKN